jgi:hypothetical protein
MRYRFTEIANVEEAVNVAVSTVRTMRPRPTRQLFTGGKAIATTMG